MTRYGSHYYGPGPFPRWLAVFCILATIAVVATQAVVLGMSAAHAQDAPTVAIVANNNIDGPVAQTAVHHYEQQGAHARRYGVDVPNPEVLGGHDCVLFVGRDAWLAKQALDQSDEADGVTIAVQGWDRYATASEVVHPETVDACIGGGA